MALGLGGDHHFFGLPNGRFKPSIFEALGWSNAPPTVVPSRLAFPLSVLEQLQRRFRVARLNDSGELAMNRLQVTHCAVSIFLELKKLLRNIPPIIFNRLTVERLDCAGIETCARKKPREKRAVLPKIGELKRVLHAVQGTFVARR